MESISFSNQAPKYPQKWGDISEVKVIIVTWNKWQIAKYRKESSTSHKLG
jgi:hypothetical protein